MSTQIADIVRCALSPARMATYEAIAPDADAALALYAWNAQICGALLPPLHICEVVVRNAVADAFEATHGARWPWNLGFERSLPRQLSPGYNALGDLQAVRNKVKTTGQVIAELKFVFWEKTFTSRHDSRIWEPQLMRVPPGVRIVVASPNFPENADRGRKETVRAVLFTGTQSRIAQNAASPTEPVDGRGCSARRGQRHVIGQLAQKGPL